MSIFVAVALHFAFPRKVEIKANRKMYTKWDWEPVIYSTKLKRNLTDAAVCQVLGTQCGRAGKHWECSEVPREPCTGGLGSEVD